MTYGGNASMLLTNFCSVQYCTVAARRER